MQGKYKKMSRGESLKEYDERRKESGFFFDLYKSMCKDMTKEEEAHVETIRDDSKALFEFTYNLKCFKERLNIEEKFPGKDAAESKKMKEAGNKAYQDGTDLQALTFYTQVGREVGSSASVCQELKDHYKEISKYF